MHVSGKPGVWRKISLQTTLREELFTIKPFVNSHLGQKQSMATQTLNHQTVSSNQNILPQIKRILHPVRFHNGEDGCFQHDPLLQLFESYRFKPKVASCCFYRCNPDLFEQRAGWKRNTNASAQITAIDVVEEGYEDPSLLLQSRTCIWSLR